MASVKFNLKSKKEKSTLIVMKFRFNGNRLVRSTKLKVPPKYWNDKTNRVRASSDFPQYKEMNNSLNKMEADIQSIFMKLSNNNDVPTVKKIKAMLDIEDKKQGKTNIPTLMSFIQSIIDKRAKDNTYSKSTIKGYKTTIGILKRYAKETRTKFEFEDIDLEFKIGFADWFYSQNYRPAYVHKQITTLVNFMNIAYDKKIINHKNYDDKNEEYRKKVHKKSGNTIYLNETELEAIATYDFSDNERLDKVRDYFILGANTALRWSDISRIKKSHISKVEYIHEVTKTPISFKAIKINTNKSTHDLVIPINQPVLEIFEKYNYELPKAISNQKMNIYIKEVGKIVGINSKYVQVDYKGNRKNEEEKHKFESIGTHTCRRSFATNAVKRGIPHHAIMAITGHKSYTAFIRYVRLEGEDYATMVHKHNLEQMGTSEE